MKLYFDSNFTEVCSQLDQGSNWQKASIGLYNGLMLNRQQANTWVDDDQNVRPVEHITQVAIIGTTITVPYHWAKWLQLICRSGTCR